MSIKINTSKLYYKDDDGTYKNIAAVSPDHIIIDEEISNTSTNPVQNKVIHNELEKKQNTLISGETIKTLNNESLLGKGNIDIKSAEWGKITGTLSEQTDLSNELSTKITGDGITKIKHFDSIADYNTWKASSEYDANVLCEVVDSGSAVDELEERIQELESKTDNLFKWEDITNNCYPVSEYVSIGNLKIYYSENLQEMAFKGFFSVTSGIPADTTLFATYVVPIINKYPLMIVNYYSSTTKVFYIYNNSNKFINLDELPSGEYYIAGRIPVIFETKN